MDFDVVTLSRIQFALTTIFHFLFPPLSIGLAAIMVIMESIYVKTKDPLYEKMSKFWVKVFAANFSVGVATGIVLEFEFGTNWATYSRYVGDIFGSPLAAEGIFAFFLESGFLAILLFGWDKVKPGTHLFSTIMVSLGSIFSAFWIVVANSWMQTPAGFHIVGEGLNARAEIVDFWAVVFNPSSMIRFFHTVTASFIVGGFFVMSISAYYILKNKHLIFAKKSFLIALIFSFIASIAQLIQGDLHSKNVAEYQPAKLAAYEGLYKTTEHAPLFIFGYPDSKTQETYGIKIPGMLSLLIYAEASKTVKGLDQFKPDERPPVWISFQMYHLMIVFGTYFILITMIALFLYWRKKLFSNRFILKIFVVSVLFPYIACEAGWIATEVGRQPWIVYGLLKTSDAVSKAISSGAVLSSIIMFSVIYILLFFVWLYVMDKKIKGGPEDTERVELLSAAGEEYFKDEKGD